MLSILIALIIGGDTAALICWACSSSVAPKSVTCPLSRFTCAWLAFSAMAAVFCSMAVHISVFTVESNSVFQTCPVHVYTLYAPRTDPQVPSFRMSSQLSAS